MCARGTSLQGARSFEFARNGWLRGARGVREGCARGWMGGCSVCAEWVGERGGRQAGLFPPSIYVFLLSKIYIENKKYIMGLKQLVFFLENVLL